MTRRQLWTAALTRRSVWSRALRIGLFVGSLQIAVNQGDHWLNRRVDGVVLIKTMLTPVIAVSVAVAAAAWAYVDHETEKTCHEISPQPTGRLGAAATDGSGGGTAALDAGGAPRAEPAVARADVGVE